MNERGWHLAQLNIGRMVAPIDAPEVADFVANLEPINALADRSAGFVWRLKTDAGNATSIHAFDDALLLLNMSVWESLETLRAFTYTTAHTDVLRRRKEWFERLEVAHLVLWWIPPATSRRSRRRWTGSTPSVATAPRRRRSRSGSRSRRTTPSRVSR